MVDEDAVSTAGDDANEDVYSLSAKRIASILFAIEREDRAALIAEMEPLHAADIADLLEQINAYDRRRLILLYGHDFDGDILSELDDGVREDVISVMASAGSCGCRA